MDEKDTLSIAATIVTAMWSFFVRDRHLTASGQNMDDTVLFDDIPAMNDLLDSGFADDDCSSYWIRTSSLDEHVGEEDMESPALTKTRLYSERPESAVDSAETIEQITDYEMLTLPIRELNRRLKSLPKAEAQKIRKRRRSLKNRDYATSCRRRRTALKESLQTENQRLKDQLREAKVNLSNAVKERDSYKRKVSQLQNAYITFNTSRFATK